MHFRLAAEHGRGRPWKTRATREGARRCSSVASCGFPRVNSPSELLPDRLYRMPAVALQDAIATVPPGRWAVAVSGGADSVALLMLLLTRGDLALHVVHLNHQTRGQASDEDAAFVANLSAERNLPRTIALLEDVERTLPALESNPSARYRAARLQLFREVVAREQLAGVILAHHADDQAETVLQRLIRGSGIAGLTGMSSESRLGELRVLRPLLRIRRAELRDFLQSVGQTWREDASNALDDYLRNRLRRWLNSEPDLHEAMLSLGQACRAIRTWSDAAAPSVDPDFQVRVLSELPEILAQGSARRWLVAQGAPPGELSEAVLGRLIEMSSDAGAAARQHFPGGLLVRRRRGKISAERVESGVPSQSIEQGEEP